MAFQSWPSSNWPEGVPHEITDYDFPLFNFLDEAAKNYPDHTFTLFNGARRTYEQVKEAADKIANFLSSRGISKGDRVAIFLPNIPQYPAIYFGILKAGAVCVTCNPMYTPDALQHQLRDAGAKAVFCMDHPEFYPTTVKAIEGTKVETVVICGVKSQLPAITGFLGGLLGKIPKAGQYKTGHVFYDRIMSDFSPDAPAVEINPAEDLALIIYTGGTTGVPKGASLTHLNFVSNIKASFEWVRIVNTPGEKPDRYKKGGHHCFLGVLPWYHSFGMSLCMLTACYTGSKLVCIPDPRAGNPPFTEVLKAVEKYKVTAMIAVPTIYSAFTNHPLIKKYDLSSIIACGSGGAPLAVELAKQFEATTGSVIFEGYGLSETGPVISINPTNLEQRKFGSVGMPIPSTDVKIVDQDEGTKELPQGEDGEIAVHGPQVMVGYWEKEEENRAAFREIGGKRYFLTGDIGHIDDEGYIIITDRKKDMIIVGGFNVYPREVEDIFFEHPKVALAAVIGVPDERSGETVKAFLQLKPGMDATEEELLDWCKDKMPGYKRPRSIEFRESLPVSVVGKVLRRELRDENKQ